MIIKNVAIRVTLLRWCCRRTLKWRGNIHLEAKKLHHFIFEITVKSYCIWMIIYTLINLKQNVIKIIDLLWRVSLYCLVKYVHTSWPTSVLSRKLITSLLSQHLNGTSSKVWKCMDQRCSAIVKHIIKCFGCLPLSLTYVPSLNSHWSVIWSMLAAWPIVIQTSPQLINISHRILIQPLL